MLRPQGSHRLEGPNPVLARIKWLRGASGWAEPHGWAGLEDGGPRGWERQCLDLSFPAEHLRLSVLAFHTLFSPERKERNRAFSVLSSPLLHFVLATPSPSLLPDEYLCLSSPLLSVRSLDPTALLTSCCEAFGEKTLSSSKDTGFPLCSRWIMESSSGSKVTALVASGPSPSSLVTGRTRAITRIFPGLGVGGGEKGIGRVRTRLQHWYPLGS